jgi:hypothetical protein
VLLVNTDPNEFSIEYKPKFIKASRKTKSLEGRKTAERERSINNVNSN